MTIFLDHNSTTPLMKLAFDAMKPYFMDLYYNPGGLQNICLQIYNDIENARLKLSRMISVRKGKLIFTSCATESNNIVLSQKIFSSILTSNIEHPSVIVPVSKRENLNIKFVGLMKNGEINLDDLEDKLFQCSKYGKTLVSIQHANSVIHTIQPIEKIAELCRSYNAYLHVDATQTFGKIKITNLDADFITVSSHKCYGPKGIAALWISDDFYNKQLDPLIFGGHQEFNLRAGTHNVPGIIGFYTAAEFMCRNIEKHNLHVSELSQIFLKRFMDEFPDAKLNGSLYNRLPGGLHITVPGVDMRSIIISLPELIISTGMACSSGESDPVMKALGKNDLVRNSFRMQIGYENTVEEIYSALDLLIPTIKNSRNFWGSF